MNPTPYETVLRNGFDLPMGVLDSSSSSAPITTFLDASKLNPVDPQQFQSTVLEVCRFSNLDQPTVESCMSSIINYAQKGSKRGVDLLAIEKKGNTVKFVPLRQAGNPFARRVATFAGRRSVTKYDNKTYISKKHAGSVERTVKSFNERLTNKIDRVIRDAGLQGEDLFRAKHFSDLVNGMTSSVKSPLPELGAWRGNPLNDSKALTQLAQFHQENCNNKPLYSALSLVVNELKSEIKEGVYTPDSTEHSNLKEFIEFLSFTTNRSDLFVQSTDDGVEGYLSRDITRQINTSTEKFLTFYDINNANKMPSFNQVVTFVKAGALIDGARDKEGLAAKIQGGQLPVFGEQQKHAVLELVSKTDTATRKLLAERVVRTKLQQFGKIGALISELTKPESTLEVSAVAGNKCHIVNQNTLSFDAIRNAYNGTKLTNRQKEQLPLLLFELTQHAEHYSGNDQKRHDVTGKADTFKNFKSFISILSKNPSNADKIVQTQSNTLRAAANAKGFKMDNPIYASSYLGKASHYANMVARMFRSGYGQNTRQIVASCLDDFSQSCQNLLTNTERNEINDALTLFRNGIQDQGTDLKLYKGVSDSDRDRKINTFSGEMERIASPSDSKTKSLFTVGNDRHATNILLSNQNGRTILTLVDSNGSNGFKKIDGKEKAILDANYDITDSLAERGAHQLSELIVATIDDDNMNSFRQTLEGLGRPSESKFYSRAQKGGDCAIESQLALLKVLVSANTYRKVKSHVIKAAITTLKNERSLDLGKNIAMAVDNGHAYESKDEWSSYKTDPRKIRDLFIMPSKTALQWETQHKWIEKFRNDAIDSLENRLEKNEFRITIDERPQQRSSPRMKSERLYLHQANVEHERAEARQAINVATDKRGIEALGKKGYTQLEIHGDGYCGQRCAAFVALQHVRDLAVSDSNGWIGKVSNLAKIFPSADLNRVINGEGPILDRDGRLPKGIERVIIESGMPGYIDQNEIRTLIGSWLGVDDTASREAPECGLVSEMHEGNKDIFTHQSITGTSELHGPLDQMDSKKLPEFIVRHFEGTGEKGNHYDIFVPLAKLGEL